MKALVLSAVFAGMLLVVGSGPADTLPSPLPRETGAIPTASGVVPTKSARALTIAPATLTEVVQQYCSEYPFPGERRLLSTFRRATVRNSYCGERSVE
jgi:hypothetical protein